MALPDMEVSIARSFLKQFYRVMSESPSNLHCFYTEDASFFHDDSSDSSTSNNGISSNPPTTVRGKSNIRAFVETLNLAGVEIDLTPGSVDVQFSGGPRAFFLVVTGLFNPAEDPLIKRPFIHSFYVFWLL